MSEEASVGVQLVYAEMGLFYCMESWDTIKYGNLNKLKQTGLWGERGSMWFSIKSQVLAYFSCHWTDNGGSAQTRRQQTDRCM